MDLLSRVFYQNLVLFLVTLPISVFFYLLPLFSFIPTLLLRLRSKAPLNDNSDFFDVLPEEEDQKEQELETEFKGVEDVVEYADSNKNGEMHKPEFSFTFRFPTYEEYSKSKNDTAILVTSECSSCTSSSKHEFSSSSLIQEPEVVNMNFTENCCGMKPVSMSDEEEGTQVHSKVEVIHEEEEIEKIEGMKFMKEESDSEDKQFVGNPDFDDEFLFQSEKDSLGTDSDTVSIGFEHMRSLMSRLVDPYSDGFLSDEDFGGEFELDDIDGDDKSERNDLDMSEESLESEDFEDNDNDLMKEFMKLEQNDHGHAHSEFLSQNDFHEGSDKASDVEFVADDDKSRNAAILDTAEDANKLESLWEHQELIEQLRMELKKVRATGLPTILEESESPKMEDLKPWKIDEMYQREDCMGELHKFYKSYRDRMRKFDIFTYQKMYAIGFLQKDPLKDPLQLLSNQKSSGPTLKSLISQNIRLFKHKSHDIDPMMKFIKELQSDLEVVYVGQMCLSWEFLHWQYGKALDLWESGPRGIRQYSEVAGEFQQFQVLIQRFIENEPFQGPRVQNYIRSRYDLRNLLQVPVIRGDTMKDRNKARTRDKSDYSITSDMLVEMLEESIRIFWRYVRADRDCIVKGQKGNHPELQAQEDLELLLEVRKSLEKKEKKLQDVLRSGSCILKRLRKSREDDSDHVLYFFSQVDMKLVARVLNMSRLTKDQLVWCHNKLSRISFAHRKIHVEPSFLLFPC